MEKELDTMDREILRFLEGDLPVEPHPFRELADRLGTDEEEIISRIRSLSEAGFIKRLGAVVKHTRVGYRYNAMVVWKMNREQIDRVKEFSRGNRGMSHVYVRKVYPGKWEYNMYTMLHAESEGELLNLIEKISDLTGCDDYRVLRTLKEFKKSSSRYMR